MTHGAEDRAARADRIAGIIAIVVVAASVVIGASVDSSNSHTRLRPPKAARCDTAGGTAADRCRSRPPGPGPAPVRAAPISGTEPSPAPESHPEALWLDTAGLVVAFAIGAVGAVVRWRDASARAVRREHRARFFRAA